MEDCKKGNAQPQQEVDKQKQRVNILMSLGIMPDLKGHYILLNILNELSNCSEEEQYKAIHNPKFKVDRALRYCIDNAYKMGTLQTLNSLIGYEVMPYKPGGKQFISLLCTYFRYFLK